MHRGLGIDPVTGDVLLGNGLSVDPDGRWRERIPELVAAGQAGAPVGALATPDGDGGHWLLNVSPRRGLWIYHLTSPDARLPAAPEAEVFRHQRHLDWVRAELGDGPVTWCRLVPNGWLICHGTDREGGPVGISLAWTDPPTMVRRAHGLA